MNLPITVKEAIALLQKQHPDALCTISIEKTQPVVEAQPYRSFLIKTGEVVKMDKEVFLLHGLYSWRRKKAASGFYCARQTTGTNRKQKTIYLHRVVIEHYWDAAELRDKFPEGWEGHHINGDRFDCRRENVEPRPVHHGKNKKGLRTNA